MRFDDNGGDSINYEPSNFDAPSQTGIPDEPPLKIDGDIARYEYDTDENSDFAQAGALFRIMSKKEQEALAQNIANSMRGVPQNIIEKQLEYFYQADKEYGEKIAKKLKL